MANTSGASAKNRSQNFSNSWRTTTWVGPPRWPLPLWVIRTVPNLVRNSPTASAGRIRRSPRHSRALHLRPTTEVTFQKLGSPPLSFSAARTSLPPKRLESSCAAKFPTAKSSSSTPPGTVRTSVRPLRSSRLFGRMSKAPVHDYQDLFENALGGYLTIGADGRITKVNATLAAWTGFPPDKFVGRRLHQFLNMAGRIYYETHIAPLLRMQGSFHEFALDFETADGGRLPVIANAAERRDGDGGVLLTALGAIKAADRRRYERQLVDSRSELQKGLASERETAELREQFIAVLGHDLRNPLAAISAGAHILQRSGALQGERERRILDMIHTTVGRMSDLIDNVLDFARGRLGGGITLNRDADHPLEPVLEQIVDELRTASP